MMTDETHTPLTIPPRILALQQLVKGVALALNLHVAHYESEVARYEDMKARGTGTYDWGESSLLDARESLRRLRATRAMLDTSTPASEDPSDREPARD